MQKVGYISSAFALKGELILKSKFYEIEEILKEGIIYIDGKKHKVTRYRPYKNNYIISIDNLNHINLVNDLIHKDVFIEQSETYIDNIIGFKVISDKKEYGFVKELFKTNVYNIRTDLNELIIPLVSEYLIDIDYDNKIVNCKNLERLIL